MSEKDPPGYNNFDSRILENGKDNVILPKE